MAAFIGRARASGSQRGARQTKQVNKYDFASSKRAAPRPAEVLKKIAAVTAARTKAVKEQARKAIVAFYRKGWSNLQPKERLSRTSIAKALVRRKIVPMKNTAAVIRILEGLARRPRKRIFLPAKNTKRKPKKK